MWNRRDYLVLASAAVASFGLTVGLFWSRTANAVDDASAPVTDVEVPTLTAGATTVTATLDAQKAHVVLLTVHNTSSEPSTARFTAAALVRAPMSRISRTPPVGQSVWSQDFALVLKAGETQTLSVELPAAAFDVKGIDPQGSNTRLMVPGSSSLLLTSDASEGKMGIVALTLASSPTSVDAAATAAPPAKEAPAKGTP